MLGFCMPPSLGEHLALLSVNKKLTAVLGPGSSLVGGEGFLRVVMNALIEVPRKTRDQMANKELSSINPVLCNGEKRHGWSRTGARELEVRIAVGGNGVLFIAVTTLQLLCWFQEH